MRRNGHAIQRYEHPTRGAARGTNANDIVHRVPAGRVCGIEGVATAMRARDRLHLVSDLCRFWEIRPQLPYRLALARHQTRSETSIFKEPPMNIAQTWSRFDAWMKATPDAVPEGFKGPATDDEIRVLE